MEKILSIGKSIYYGCIGIWVDIRYRKPIHWAENKRVVVFRLTKEPFKRYLYILFKLFSLAGYQVLVVRKFSVIGEFFMSQYGRFFFNEGLYTSIKKGQIPIGAIYFDNNLDPDYFSSLLFPSEKSELSYHVPMLLHPEMYRKAIFDAPIHPEMRKNSIFMAGNFSESDYRQIENNSMFKVKSRIAMLEILRRKKLLFSVETCYDVQKFVESADDKKVIIVDNSKCYIRMEELRPTLSKFTFFLAFSGVYIPLCHNLIEALSVGMIPIVEEGYAKLLVPPLKNLVNCIIVSDPEKIEQAIQFAFSLAEEEIAILRGNVMDYYQENLSPSKVVEKVISNSQNKIYLQAEKISANLLMSKHFQP